MKKGLALVTLALMSWTVAGSALAGPYARFARVPRQQQQRAIPQPQQNEAHDNDGNGEKDRADKPLPPQSGASGEARPGGNAQGPGPQFGGRGGTRMSVEERQKLRRQINEAGRSLYTPAGNK